MTPGAAQRQEGETFTREQILDSFYDSITGCVFLLDTGRIGQRAFVREVRDTLATTERDLDAVPEEAPR